MDVDACLRMLIVWDTSSTRHVGDSSLPGVPRRVRVALERRGV